MAVQIRYPSQTPLVDASGLVNSLADLGDLYQTRRADDKAADAYSAWVQASQAPQQQPMTLASLAPQGGVQRSPLEAPMDPASARVASAHAASGGTPPQGAIEAYIRHAAQKRGIDPEIAVKVAMSEGGVTDPTRQSDVVKNGVREQSYGPFQLYMNGGLGNEAMAAGIDPRTDWKGGIDFALDRAREGGWGPWYGAEKVGVTGMMGIGGQQQAQPQQMAQMEPQGAPMGAGESLLPPPDVMKALLRSPSFKPLAIDMMRTAQAARQGDPEAELPLRKPRAEVDRLQNPQADQFTLGAGDVRYDAAGNVVARGGERASSENLPTSIQEFERAQSDPEFAEFMKTGKGRDSSLTAGDRQAIRDSEDVAMASTNTIDMLRSVIDGEPGKTLNDRAGYGATAGAQSWMARNDPTGLFDDAKGEATTELQNVVLNQALSSLKSIFGAAPTEGERKILVDLQASIDKTPQERKAIIERAIQMAERRQTFNMDRATELRGGTYYKPGSGYQPNGAGNRTSSGVQWSIDD